LFESLTMNFFGWKEVIHLIPNLGDISLYWYCARVNYDTVVQPALRLTSYFVFQFFLAELEFITNGTCLLECCMFACIPGICLFVTSSPSVVLMFFCIVINICYAVCDKCLLYIYICIYIYICVCVCARARACVCVCVCVDISLTLFTYLGI